MPTGPTSGQQRPSTRGLAHNRPAQPLNVSTLSTATTTTSCNGQGPGPPKLIANGGPRLSSVLNTTPITPIHSPSSNNNNNNSTNNNNSNSNNVNSNNNNNINLTSSNALNTKHRVGAREALTSLGLLCLVSLLLALLSLIFLLKISPGGRELPPPPPGPTSADDYIIVYDVTLALCALSLSLNLCCLLVCAIQFLFAVKLVRAPATSGRGNKYLQKSSVSRVCAVGGFFISIPIFLTGIILYTFTQFHSTPAIITSVLIGVGIIFCGCAMVHNVFVWQKEKTICVRQNPPNLTLSTQLSTISPPPPPPVQYMNHNGSAHIHLNTSTHTPLSHNQLNHSSQVTQLTPVTPLSPNHSHVSFNHSYVPTYAVRAATATPPTPKVNTALLGGRDASGSVSPGMPTNNTSANLDLSNVTNTSPHELSTLV